MNYNRLAKAKGIDLSDFRRNISKGQRVVIVWHKKRAPIRGTVLSTRFDTVCIEVDPKCSHYSKNEDHCFYAEINSVYPEFVLEYK